MAGDKQRVTDRRVYVLSEAMARWCKGRERDQQQSREINIAGIALPAKTPGQHRRRRARRSNKGQELYSAFSSGSQEAYIRYVEGMTPPEGEGYERI